MAENKKQHYVPKFYLKNFATESSQRAINILNIKSERVITGAKLASQCCQNYFYGKDLALERGLGVLEGQTSLIFQDIIDNSSMPRVAEQRTLLAIYLVLQRMRTVVAMRRSDEMLDGFLKIFLQEEFSAESLAGVKARFTDGPIFNTVLAFMLAPILFDLGLVLLVNSRDIEFVTSDNPVVHANRFCELRFPGHGEGMSTSGLMVILPLTPQLTVMLYDKGVYELRNNKNGSIHRLTDADVLKFNELQTLNALENIYFSAADQIEPVDALFQSTKGRRHAELTTVQELVISETPGTYVLPGPKNAAANKTESIIMGSHQMLDVRIRLSFLRFRHRKKFHYDGSAAGPVRDPAWVQIVDDFSRAVADQALGYGDIEQFARGHTLWPRVGNWKKGLFGASRK